MVKTQLAPGFRFHPTDVELVRYYLKRKVLGKKLLVEAIAELDIYKFEPSDLPDKSYLKTGDLKWYFFCPREKKYSSGVRTNRATEFGYWKTTGRDRDVLYNDELAGRIKTLVYHRGKPPRGERTNWVMHEYKLEDKKLTEMDVAQDAYVLCVLFKKDGPGPKNGAQYGAPFKEEEWSDGEEDTDNAAALPFADNPIDLPGPSKATSLIATTSQAPKDIGAAIISESCISDVAPSAYMPMPLPLPLSYADNTPVPLLDSNSTLSSAVATQTPDDDIYLMLDYFVEDESFGGYSQTEVRHEFEVSGDGERPPCLGEDDAFNVHHVPGAAPYGLFEGYNCDPIENTSLFLELEDLVAPLTDPVAQSENLAITENITQIQDQEGFPADPSCSAATRHGTPSSQSQSQPAQPFSEDLKERSE